MRGTSSLCVRCATVSVDHGVSPVSRMRHEGVISRPIVLTLPAMLRTTFYHNATVLLSAFMRCGVRCLDDVFTRGSGRDLQGGSIVVIQTHGTMASPIPICLSLPPVAEGIAMPVSGCIWTTCPIPCCVRSGRGIC